MKNSLMILTMIITSCSQEAIDNIAANVAGQLANAYSSSDYMNEAGYEEIDYSDIKSKDSSMPEEVSNRLDEIKELTDSIWSQRKLICSRDEALREELKADLNNIKSDQSLLIEEKHMMSKEILNDYKEDLEADAEIYDQCVDDNYEDIRVYDEKLKDVHDACFVRKTKPYKKKVGHRGKKGQFDFKHKNRFEGKILSQECSDLFIEVDDVEEKEDVED